MKKYSFIVLFFSLIGLLTAETVTVNKLEINPLNRALIYLSAQADGFTTTLDKDKTGVVINIQNAKTTVNAPVTSNGIINSLSAAKNGAQVFINVKMTDKRGYSSVYLPMSRAIMLEVFDWTKLSQAEDNYRSGLLAFEGGQITEAKDYFLKANNKETPNAAALLGIIFLREGKPEQALKYLNLAADNHSNIADAYSALSQIYSLKGDNQKAVYFKATFTKMTGLANFQQLDMGSLKLDSLTSPDSLSFLFNQLQAADNANDSNLVQNNNTDTTKAKQIMPAAENRRGILPEWLSPTVFYVVFGSLLFVLMLVSSFFKWRKRQIAMINAQMQEQPRKSKFNSDLKKAERQLATSSQAANAYKQYEDAADNKPKKIVKEEKIEDINDNKVRDLARHILENKTFKTEKEELEKAGKKSGYSKSPKLELALHLHQEQQKQKNKNISQLNKNDIPNSGKDLEDTAKKLGIEKASLSTKKNLSNIEENPDKINNLASKFKSKK